MSNERPRRNTRQREVILQELRRLTSHPTAVGLYQIVRRRLPKISLGTVYRNLELLTEMGTIQKLDFGAAEARFDANHQPHHHVRCVRCGRVDDIQDAPLDLSGIQGHDLGGYRIVGYRLDFLGICPRCFGRGGDQQNETPSHAPDPSRP